MSLAPPPAARPQDQITIISHSTLFYWWPVWAVGLLLGLLTFADKHYLVTVPEDTELARDATVEVPSEGKTIKGREVIILPQNSHDLPREDPRDPNSRLKP